MSPTSAHVSRTSVRLDAAVSCRSSVTASRRSTRSREKASRQLRLCARALSSGVTAYEHHQLVVGAVLELIAHVAFSRALRAAQVRGSAGQEPVPLVDAHLAYRQSDFIKQTLDHGLRIGASTAERGYVALSRGWHTNRIYATHDSGWQDAIAHHHPHTLALHQHPDPDHPAAPPLEPTAGGKQYAERDTGNVRPGIAM